MIISQPVGLDVLGMKSSPLQTALGKMEAMFSV